MEDTLLTKVRKMNWVLQESATGAFSFDDLCRILNEMTDANVYLANRRGKILGSYFDSESDIPTVTEEETDSELFPDEYNDGLMGIEATAVNVSADEVNEMFGYKTSVAEKLYTMVPVIGGRQRLGTLMLTRKEPEFTAEELVLAEYGATVVGLEIIRRKSIEREKKERERAVVKMAIGTLSYSEIEAVQQIFAELNGKEGLLVASKIADRSGITRSVIVNALRKLESAGVIESRSLGMKGTHIKILNDHFYDELEKLD